MNNNTNESFKNSGNNNNNNNNNNKPDRNSHTDLNSDQRNNTKFQRGTNKTQSLKFSNPPIILFTSIDSSLIDIPVDNQSNQQFTTNQQQPGQNDHNKPRKPTKSDGTSSISSGGNINKIHKIMSSSSENELQQQPEKQQQSNISSQPLLDLDSSGHHTLNSFKDCFEEDLDAYREYKKPSSSSKLKCGSASNEEADLKDILRLKKNQFKLATRPPIKVTIEPTESISSLCNDTLYSCPQQAEPPPRTAAKHSCKKSDFLNGPFGVHLVVTKSYIKPKYSLG